MKNFSYLSLVLEEKAEFDKHKWIESEKAGRDIGVHAARMSWERHHRQKWLDKRVRDIMGK